MNRPVRTALIGCGKVARTHAKAFASLAQSEFVAVCDPTAEKAEALARQFGVAAFTSLETMLREAAPQVISVCTPHPAHTEAVITAARRGVHALVEKPLAADLRDCDRAIEACRRHGVTLGVVSQRRAYPPVIRVKAALEAGKIGRPILATVSLLGWRDPSYYLSDWWRGAWETEGGGVLVNQAPHLLDLLLWLLGPIDTTFGLWGNFNHPEVPVDDTAIAAIRFKSGALGCLVLSNSQRPGLHGRIHIHGSNGASVGVQTERGSSFISGVSAETAPPLNDLWTIPGEEHLPASWEIEDLVAPGAADPMDYYHKVQISDFLDAIADGRNPAVTGQDGRLVVELFTAIYRSQRDGRPVRFPLRPERRKDYDGRLSGGPDARLAAGGSL
jgi:UDP-N-acetyl-2-amino-2-deoxyglucuronate dehydrogenase